MSDSRDDQKKKPNIVWFCTDQQRFDTIASLGNPHIRTPAIDRLVRGGVAFTRHYVNGGVKSGHAAA
ncbi:sulfatase-like hydrolase/transferase [Manganibacter manganicus]|uniref:sulfatase-like hydrolase/transferase n=1 Tax=Manganibacter manganicus TaxID=1873176 RepID=UPI001FD96B26|nr:sulfatase-like hydrolase/transferase [Pseudaminobacter manganicus]